MKDVDSNFDKHAMPYDVLWLDIEHTNGKRWAAEYCTIVWTSAPGASAAADIVWTSAPGASAAADIVWTSAPGASAAADNT